MTDPITEIFSKHLPSIPSAIADEFAQGMRSYHTAFKSHRDVAMNYEALPEYLNAQHTIMEVSRDQFWPYTPFFRKSVSLAIQEVFKTRITSLGTNSVAIAQTLIFVDEHSNRWIMTVGESPLDPDMNRIYMHFPRGNTPIFIVGIQTPIKKLNDPALANGGIAILTSDTSHWNE